MNYLGFALKNANVANFYEQNILELSSTLRFSKILIVTLMLKKLTTMKLQRIILLLLGFSFFTLSMDAQSWCGTNHTDECMARISKNVKFANENVTVRNVMDKRYVPVKFHLIADSQGNGRISDIQVYQQLCRLNAQYDSLGLVFYIDDGFNYIDNTAMFNHATNAPGQYNGVRNQYPMSLNLFVPNATFSDGVAGYYTPQNDYIVVQISSFDEVNNVTLGHELGHLFSLPHPHVGWETEPYTPAVYGETVTIQNINGVKVELMNEVNCTDAGDRICDTPPDYGFTQNGAGLGDEGISTVCFNPWEGEVKDRNGVVIVSIPNTIMGYNSCTEIIFTHGQANAVRADYDQRTNLNKTYEPDTSKITEQIVLNSPTAFETTQFYNEVIFEWEPVDNAQGYVLTLNGSGTFEYITENTQFTSYDLAPGASYSWTVYPINEVGWCQDLTPAILFFTSADEVSSTNEIDFVTNFNVHPNPILDQNFTISIESDKQIDAAIYVYDVTGKAVVNNLQEQISQGRNSIPIQLNNVATGLYNLIIKTSEGIISEKLIIK